MRRPAIFIGSSSESLDVAFSLQASLEYETDPTVWTQEVFRPTSQTLADLVGETARTDFAAFIFAPDDVISVRGEQANIVRDNVLFELGLFIGALGVDRCFLIVPRNSKPLKLPTDLLGVVPLSYAADRSDGRLSAALGPASHEILKVARRLGARSSVQRSDEKAAPNIFTDSDVQALTDQFIKDWKAEKITEARDRLSKGAPMHMMEDEDGQATADIILLFEFLNTMAEALLAGRVDEAAVRQTFQGPVHNVWRHAFTYLAPLNVADEWWDPPPKIAELDRRWSREDL